MRTSNYRKQLPISKTTWKVIWGVLAAGLLAGIIFFFTYYKVDQVEVMGSSHYSQEEIKAMILRGPLASNSVLAPVLYTKKEAQNVPFVEGFSVTQINRSTICISVKEKKPVGCIPYLDSYVYFDRNGIFIEGSKTRDESVPYFDGIQVSHVIMNEKLPIKGTTVLNTAVALATIFQKNDMVPDHIQFDENYQISLLYGDITVMLGKDQYLEDKMTRVIAILPQISGKKGILHLENVSDTSKTITFEQEAVEVTSENWNGGYDEYGDYTGDGEYDENGNYVGAKPMTALDYALAAWTGGYDGDGDYTGAGEYDANGNYVGAAPTQESLDANGDWQGGYDENGGYTGSGAYDQAGNYVGPNPNDTSETDASGNSDGSQSDGSEQTDSDGGGGDSSDQSEYTYDENGGYYDSYGNYYDGNGGYYDESGNYYDENGGYYDENGDYYN